MSTAAGYVEAMRDNHLPTRHTISHATDDSLAGMLEACEILCSDDTVSDELDAAALRIAGWIESEQEQREYATHSDARVRDAFGYGSRNPS